MGWLIPELIEFIAKWQLIRMRNYTMYYAARMVLHSPPDWRGRQFLSYKSAVAIWKAVVACQNAGCFDQCGTCTAFSYIQYVQCSCDA